MKMGAIVTSVNHTLTGKYALRSRSNFLSVFISNKIEENDISGTEYVVLDESSFPFKTSGEGALTTCKESNIFLWNKQGTVRLFDSQSQLSKRTFCKILSNLNVTSKLVKVAKIKTSLPTRKIWQPFGAEGDQCSHLGTWKISFKYKKSVLDVWLQVRHDSRTTPATSIFWWFSFHDPNKLRGSFLESPKTFRANFGWHNSLCIFKTKASRGRRLWSNFYFYFYSLYKIWKDQLYRISESELYKWLLGPVKFSGFSRNVPQVWFLETHIYQVIKARDNSALQVRTIKNVVT